jgi:pantetheine-phosphate adenylyltransferase
MSQTVLFPGTFDPITHGHINLIERISHIFDHVIVAIAGDASVGKTPLFDLSERQALAKIVLEKYKNVEVIAFHGLTINCALTHGARAIVRGVRSSSDLAYEQELAAMNYHLEPSVETVFLTPTAKYFHISASLVRQIAQLQGNISQLVPEHVAKALQRKFSN